MKIFNLVFFICSFWLCYAQDIEKVKVSIDFSDLQFDSNQEEDYFKNTIDKNDDLDIFFSINSTISEKDKLKFEENLSELLKKYTGISESDKKFKKDIESCFKEIHKKFLVQYVEDADFNNLVQNGVYNCLSATALYAIALQKLKIPFNIRKGDFHIYISAAPDTHNIILESTLPEEGVIYFSKKFRQNFLEELEKNKLVSSEDKQLSHEEKFEKYSNFDEVIDIQQLVAYQYYNIGVQNFNETKFEKAQYSLEKAAFLHDDPIISIMLLTSISYQLPANGPQNLDQGIKPFVKLINYNPEVFEPDFLPSIRTFIAARITDNDETLLEDVFFRLKKEIRQQKYIDQLESEHNLCKSYFLAKKTKYKEAYEAVILSYNYDSTRFDLNAIFADVVSNEVQNCEDFVEFNHSLALMIDKYPILTDYEYTRKTYLISCLIIAGDYYLINKPKQGLEYLDEFRHKAKLWEIKKLKEPSIGYAYGEASSYDVRQEKYSSARNLLNEGLAFDLFNESLNRKLTTMDNSGY